MSEEEKTQKQKTAEEAKNLETEAHPGPESEEPAEGKAQLAQEGTTTPAAGKSKKTVVIVVAVVAVIAIAAAAFWFVNVKMPYDNAVRSYNAAVASLDQKNSDLDAATADLTALSESEDKPLSDDVSTTVSDAIGKAQAAKETAPDMPKETAAINAAASTIEAMGDYSEQLKAISDAKAEYEKSVKQMRQVTNPPEAFVIQRVQSVPTVTGVEAVTEDNDPNGQLNKSGGYTACVYFTSSMVDLSDVSRSSKASTEIVAYGTDGGGAVEVFSTADEAERRKEYLSAFDGTLFSLGSHEVVGTCVVRTSDKLTGSQQKEFTANIIAALIELK